MILFVWPNAGILFLNTTAKGVYWKEELELRTDVTRTIELKCHINTDS